MAPLVASAMLVAIAPDLLTVAHGGRSALLAGARSLASDAERSGASAVRASALGRYLDHPPIADGAAVLSTLGPVSLTLGGMDRDSDPLTVSIVTAPMHGTLTRDGAPLATTFAPGPVLYTPAPDFAGEDDLSFVVSDGLLSSEPVVRHLRVYATRRERAESAPRVYEEASAPGGPDFSLEHPQDYQRAQVTADYLHRAEEILDGHAEAQRTGRMPGDAPEERTPSLPPLVPTAGRQRAPR